MINKDDELHPEHKEFYEWFHNRLEDPYFISIKKAFECFIDIMGQEDWLKRKGKVINFFNKMEKKFLKNPEIHDNNIETMSFYQDLTAWYLYLIETIFNNPAGDEPTESSRIYPFFATIGKHIDELKNVKGIESKLNELLIKKKNQPDSTLFEIVVAICYLKNGWNVEFIPETSTNKTPDLHVIRDNCEYFVECKRLAKVTDYAKNERKEWLKRWERLVQLLKTYPYSTFIYIQFKVEIKKTNINILVNIFHEKRKFFMKEQAFIFENEEVFLAARHMNMNSINSHLDKWDVKYPSPELYALFDVQYDPKGNYTHLFKAKLLKSNPGKEGVLNIFVESVDIVHCAKWDCISIESIDKKSKDIKKLLAKAVRQAPLNGSTIIHLGYETLHDPSIEFNRNEKIDTIMSSFDFGQKNIASVFCHSFQTRNFPNNKFDVAETTRPFDFIVDPTKLLSENLLITDWDGAESGTDTHWRQDLMEQLNK